MATELDGTNLELAFRGMMAASFGDQCDVVGIEQETEMRRAFFGGAKAATDFPQHSGFDFEDVRDELRIFLEEVNAGRA